MTPDALGAARPTIKTTQRTIILIPKDTHLMIDSKDAGILANARFVRVEDTGNIRPLPLQNVQTTTLPVADMALTQIDQEYLANFAGARNDK